jgi:hypothetical protein
MNFSKSQLLTENTGYSEILKERKMQQVTSYKYLGVEVHSKRKATATAAAVKLSRVIASIWNKSKCYDVQTEQLIKHAYIRSHMIYLYTPLYMAGYVSEEEVNIVERKAARLLLGVGRSMSNFLIDDY